MKIRKTLYADEGMIITNGEVYGKQISLSENDNEYMYYEIAESEYERIEKDNEQQTLNQ